jgi:hypothetical protein
LPAELQVRVIQSMREYAEAGYDLTDYLLDRNLNSMISDALSLEKDLPRIVYHPGSVRGFNDIGSRCCDVDQTDFKHPGDGSLRIPGIQDACGSSAGRGKYHGERDCRGAYLALPSTEPRVKSSRITVLRLL